MAIAGSLIFDTKVDQGGFESGTKGMEKNLNGISSGLKKIGIAAAAAFAVKKIIDWGKAGVTASTELTNAMTGVRSVVEGQGRSFAEAQKFLNDYVSDGLVPATNAANAYKNLAARGYDTKQIEQVMTSLKDSAAYGRQAAITPV